MKSRAGVVVTLPQMPANFAVESHVDVKVPGSPSSCKGAVTVPCNPGEQVEPACEPEDQRNENMASITDECKEKLSNIVNENDDDATNTADVPVAKEAEPTEPLTGAAWLAGAQPEATDKSSSTTAKAEPAKDEESSKEQATAGQPPQQPPSTGSHSLPGATAEDDLNVVGLGVTLDYIQGLARQAGAMGQRSRFHCVREPQLHLRAYLTRLRSYFLCSSECYVLTLAYIDRLIQRHPEIVVSPLSSHRLLITALTLAAKFFDDTFYSNAYYAWVGGLRVEELNSLEKTFLRLLDWRLHIQPEEFEFYQRMIKQSALRCMTASSAPKPREHFAGA